MRNHVTHLTFGDLARSFLLLARCLPIDLGRVIRDSLLLLEHVGSSMPSIGGRGEDSLVARLQDIHPVVDIRPLNGT